MNFFAPKYILTKGCCFLLLLFFTSNSFAQSLSLDELMSLADKKPDSITEYLGPKEWKQYLADTVWSKDRKTWEEYNVKWGYKEAGDSTARYWLFYKKKVNSLNKDKGYMENIQYSIACPICFKKIESDIWAAQWAKTQDDRSDQKVMQTYDAGDFSIILVTHFKGEKEWYDVLVVRKKPVQ